MNTQQRVLGHDAYELHSEDERKVAAMAAMIKRDGGSCKITMPVKISAMFPTAHQPVMSEEKFAAEWLLEIATRSHIIVNTLCEVSEQARRILIDDRERAAEVYRERDALKTELAACEAELELAELKS